MEVIFRPPALPSHMGPNAAFFLPGLFAEYDMEIGELMNELISHSASQDPWIPMHGQLQAHRMHTDPASSPVFQKITRHLARVFHMNVEKSRANAYFHHDWKP